MIILIPSLGLKNTGWSLMSFSSPQKISYPWWKRLARIYGFLKKSRKKRKQDKREEKRKKKEEKKKEKRFKRRKRRRQIKVILYSFFRKKKLTPKELAKKQEQKRIKGWKKRKRRRLLQAYFRGFFKAKTKSERSLRIKSQQKKEKVFIKYRRKRIFRLVIERNSKIIKDVVKGKGLPVRKKKAGPPIWKQIFEGKQIKIATNSLVLFLMSYFFIDFFTHLSMAVTSLLFEYKTIIYYYNIEFLVDYDDWFADSIKTIFATGPIVGLIIAFLSMVIYSKVYLETGILKILLLWSMFHGANSIIGGTLIGNIMGKGFGYVIMYLYYSDTGKLIMSLLMILISIIIGTVSTKYWIMSANSYVNYSKPHQRTAFMLSQVLIPYILGTFIIWLITLPNGLRYDTNVNIALIFMVLPPLFLHKYYQEYYFDEDPRKIKFAYKIIFFAIIFLISYRLLLDIGLRIG